MAERLKSVLIVLLILALVGLLFLSYAIAAVSRPLLITDLVYEVLSRGGSQGSSDAASLETAAFPCRIAVSDGTGVFTPLNVWRYDETLSTSRQIMEEALGSASGVVQITSEEYAAALRDCGILYIYDLPLPFYMLYAWVDYGRTELDFDVYSLFVHTDGVSVSLLLRTAEDGFYRFDTQSNPQYILSVCSSYTPNGVFAFDLETANCDPFDPLLLDDSRLPFYSVLPSVFGGSTEVPYGIMADLSINSYLASAYREGDSMVYVESGSSLRITNEGRIIYSSTQSDGIPINFLSSADEKERSLEMLNQVYTIAVSVWKEASSSNCVLSLVSFEKDENGDFVFVFGAYIGGCFIELDQPACSVVVSDGRVTSLSVTPIRLAAYGSADFLPFTQAAAAMKEPGTLRIQFEKGEGGNFFPVMRALKGGTR